MSHPIRINKYIASSGICSRKAAEAFVFQQRVTIDGKIALITDTVMDNQVVCLDGKIIEPISDKVYIMLNKPAGITCSVDPAVKDNVVKFINHRQQIFPIGRLDKASVGLLLLTNDGDIVNPILRSENNHEKEYLVKVDKTLTKEALDQLQSGITIYNPVANRYQKTKPCVVTQLDQRAFKIILTQGLNRQIRRMCSALGYQVSYLKRIRVMHLQLGNLPEGKWRYLTDTELAILYETINR